MTRPNHTRLHSLKIQLLSFLIITLLLLQAGTSFFCLPGWQFPGRFSILRRLCPPPKKSWPIINYPMYSSAHYNGDQIPRYRVVGILDDATERPISAQDLGINPWHFLKGFVKAGLLADNQALTHDFVELYQTRHGKPLSRVRVENHPLIFSNSRVKTGPIEIVKMVQIEQDDS